MLWGQKRDERGWSSVSLLYESTMETSAECYFTMLLIGGKKKKAAYNQEMTLL